jgi:CRISPR-associated RAMP protein (TIGR02581 family)
MHKLQTNRASLHLVIEPRGPVLIRSGQYNIDPSHPDLEWVRTTHGLGVETVYLPGASLKGVIRSQAERILHAMERKCCDLFNTKSGCMDQKAHKESNGAKRYQAQCAACRTFGSMTSAGRCLFADAYPWPADADREQALAAVEKLGWLRTRTGVAIDRKTGGTKRGALYDMEVLERGRFHTEISLVNFQLWQLRLLLHVLRDLDEGFIRLGSGKSRGMGRVGCTIDRVVLDWAPKAGGQPGPHLPGLGKLAPKLAAEYGLAAAEADHAPLDETLLKRAGLRGLFMRLELAAGEIPALEQALDEPWQAFLADPGLAAGGAS